MFININEYDFKIQDYKRIKSDSGQQGSGKQNQYPKFLHCLGIDNITAYRQYYR